MNVKDLREIRRRFRPEKSNITKLRGCLVNGEGRIVSKISQSMDSAESHVSTKLLSVLKRALSGHLGTSLTEIEYSTKQVSESPRHALLMRLRQSELSDEGALDELYALIIESLKLEGGYAILLANDIYDVPSYSKDGSVEGSTERFSYIVCAICPIKQLPEAITFRESDSSLHLMNVSGALSACEIGFTFPLFDERKTNIYGALLYKRSLTESYSDFCERVLDCEAKLPPSHQRVAFSQSLAEALGDELDISVIRSLHEQVEELEMRHKEEKSHDELTISKETVRNMLECSGVSGERLDKLSEALDESLGTNAIITPRNIIKTNKYELKTPEITVKVDPEFRSLVTTQTVNGEKYLMIKISGGVEVNGINIKLDE